MHNEQLRDEWLHTDEAGLYSPRGNAIIVNWWLKKVSDERANWSAMVNDMIDTAKRLGKVQEYAQALEDLKRNMRVDNTVYDLYTNKPQYNIREFRGKKRGKKNSPPYSAI